MIRHFTVTGFVTHRGRTLLHWHRKLGMWLPPGGHIEPDEDPIQAVIREVEEESGLSVMVVNTGPGLAFEHPEQLCPPVTILVEDIPEPGNPHQHIDLIYFCRPQSVDGLNSVEIDPAMVWVGRETLELKRELAPESGGAPALIPDDVRILALQALALESSESQTIV